MNLDTQSLQPIINFIWSVADDVLINKYLENQYQDVILPMTVLRRLDLALEPEAWYDKKKMKVGYEIAFNKYFYKYDALRPLSEIAADILALENETEHLLKEIVE